MLVRDDDRQRGRYAAMKEAFARGLRWYPQITSLPNMFEVGLSDPFMFALDQPGGAMNCEPLHDLFDEITGMRTVEERWAAYQRPGFREQFVRDTDTERWNANYWPFVYVGNAPGHEDWTGRRIVELAAEQGVKPGQLWFDLAMESHLEETVLRELLENDHFRLGLGDAGAHNGQICDYRYPTYFLSHWVRELDFPLERAIRMMTTLEAECYGITDRGSITPGLAADVVVFDPETVKDGPIRKVNDLPARMPRLISEPEGVDYVVVNGTVIRDHNQDAVGPEGPFPGKVLREFHRET
jgi:N-acyl-D-aspartate/D-glutamate deacylase